jgi:hypothetical protein
MKNQVQLITYVDRLGGGGMRDLRALLAEGARLDVKDRYGNKPQQVICIQPTADPAAKPLVLAALVRHRRLELLGRELLRCAARWDHEALRRGARGKARADPLQGGDVQV